MENSFTMKKYFYNINREMSCFYIVSKYKNLHTAAWYSDNKSKIAREEYAEDFYDFNKKSKKCSLKACYKLGILYSISRKHIHEIL